MAPNNNLSISVGEAAAVSKEPSAVPSTTNFSSGKKRIYNKSKTTASNSKSNKGALASSSSVLKSSISKKAKTKESTGTGSAKSNSRSKNGEVKTADIWVVHGVPYLRKPKIIRDQEKEEERQEQIGKILEARESERKFLPQSTRRKNARPLSIQQIRDKIHHQDQLHSDPLITVAHTLDRYKKNPVSIDTDDSDFSNSSWDLIREAFGEAEGEGKVNAKLKKSSCGRAPAQDLSNNEELVLPSTSRQTAFSISGEHNNDVIPSTRPEPEPAKVSKKKTEQEKKDEKMYHFGQVKITSKRKNKGGKRRTKFVPTNEFFKGTVFENMFNSS